MGVMFCQKISSRDVATIDDKGVLTAKAVGETSVVVTDEANKSATSLKIRIAEKQEGGGDCPLGDEMLCMLMCLIQPDLPWCK